MNYAIPSYICNKQTSGVGPFICTVEIGGIQYIGATARTKKEAEIKAARTALLAIQGIFYVLFILKEVFFLFNPSYSLSKLFCFPPLGVGVGHRIIHMLYLLQASQRVVQMATQNILLCLEKGKVRRQRKSQLKLQNH